MKTSAEQAYEFIRTEILASRFPSGSRLPEEKIAAQLNISRTPVRDALRRLHSDGLIDLTANSGARVASWSAVELMEMSELRALLESFAVGLAARKIDSAGVSHLARLCDEMETALAAGKVDLDVISANNVAFHRSVANAAGNSRLTANLESLWTFPLMVRKFALFGDDRLKRSLDHHREITAALQAGDAQWAEAIMRTHILAARAYDAALVSDPQLSESSQSQVAS